MPSLHAKRFLGSLVSVFLSGLVAAAIAIASHAGPGALVDGFEIEGNFLLDGDDLAGTLDWENVGDVVPVFDEVDTGTDDKFGGGSHEQEPDGWTFTTGQVLGKGDFSRLYVARQVDIDNAFLWMAFERLDVQGQGSLHANFEINRSEETIVNSKGEAIPRRTEGDLLFVYDYPGGSAPVEIEIREWIGGPLSGTWELVSFPESAAFGDINATEVPRPQGDPFGGGTVGARNFGEIGIDLDAVLEQTGRGSLGCPGFSSAWVKSRTSGQSFNAALKDRVGPTGVDISRCPGLDLQKGVRNVTQGESEFGDNTSAQVGDTLEYRFTLTNDGIGAAHNVVISDEIPDFTTFVSCTDGCSTDGPPVTEISWSFETVEVDETIVVFFRVVLDDSIPEGTQIQNAGTVDSDETEPQDSPPTTTTVECPPSCDDGASCTEDFCDPETSRCVNDPVDTRCDDAEICTVDECRPDDPNADAETGCVNEPGNAGTVCRESAGVCDPAEECTGTDSTCPDDQFNQGNVCRESAGVCDVAETCPGDSPDCPADGFQEGTVCRDSAGECDVEETCPGTGPECPADDFQDSTVVCRDSAGVCDVEETCPGDGPNCPENEFEPSTTVCREAGTNADAVCDIAENCPGDGADCPADEFQPAGTDCDDFDNIPCTDDFCDPSGNCVSEEDDTRCDDGSACTSDRCEPNSELSDADGCVNEGVDVPSDAMAVGSSRAYGLSLLLLDGQVIEPTPDTANGDSGPAAEIPADPAFNIQALSVSKDETINDDSAFTMATATAADVKLLNQGTDAMPNWLVTANSIRVVSTSHADATTTGSDYECELQDVVVNGEELGTVQEPVEKRVVVPGLGTTIIVKLCERIPSGAAAGEIQPVPAGDDVTEGGGTLESDMTVNGIHVTVESGSLEPITGETATDLVVSHAESSAEFGLVCEVPPHVSGSAFVVGIEADEELIDTENTALQFKMAEVLLPSTGGVRDATLAKVGPIGDGMTRLVESNNAFSHTEGEVDPEAGTSHSESHAQVHTLDVLDDGSGPLIEADLVRAECTADAGPGGPATSGKTMLTSLSIGGTNIPQEFCNNSDDPTLCTPAPNTEIPGDGTVLIRLNEQIDASTADTADLTVNAIHVFILGEGNPLGLPVGAEIIVSNAHCDAAP